MQSKAKTKRGRQYKGDKLPRRDPTATPALDQLNRVLVTLIAHEHAKLPGDGTLTGLGRELVKHPTDENFDRFASELAEYQAATKAPTQTVYMTDAEFSAKFNPPADSNSICGSRL